MPRDRRANTRSHALYRFYDREGLLLYVGITMNPSARWDQHRHDKPWWSEVARISVEAHSSRQAAIDAERVAIQVERPRWNIVHNATPASPLAPTHALRISCDECHQLITSSGALHVASQDVTHAELEWAEQAAQRSGISAELLLISRGELADLPTDARWRALHLECLPAASSYDLEFDEPPTADTLLRWTLHLNEKEWLAVTDWTTFVWRLLEHRPRPVQVAS